MQDNVPTTQETMTLNCLFPGARLFVETKKDIRCATVSSITETRILLSVCSPSGRTYRKVCKPNAPVIKDGEFLILGKRFSPTDVPRYDLRW